MSDEEKPETEPGEEEKPRLILLSEKIINMLYEMREEFENVALVFVLHGPEGTLVFSPKGVDEAGLLAHALDHVTGKTEAEVEEHPYAVIDPEKNEKLS